MTFRKPSIVYIHGAEPLVGVGRRFKELHKRLLNQFNVTLLSLGGPSLEKECFEEGIFIKCCFPVFGKLLSLQSSGSYYQYRFLHYLLSPLMVQKILSKTDVIHEEMSPIPFFTPLYVNKPVILTVNEIRNRLNFECFGVLGGLPFTIEKILKYVPYDAVISVSRVTHERLSRMGIPNILIPNGVDVDKFAPTRGMNSKPYLCVLTVTRLVEHKGCYDFLKIAERICRIRNDVKFFLIGRGPLESKIRSLIKRKGLENNVVLLKNLSEEDYVRTIQNCDIYLHTNPNQEGFGLSVAEAMSCGKPVVAYNVPGVNELVDTDCGTLVKPRDTEAMVNALLEFIESKNRRDEYGKSGRELILKKYSWDKSAKMLHKVYLSLLTSKSKKA